ncbi:hypothetical protein OWV82_012337 [Melia azedarach]|uniref:Uncharacterized protein n=1 Tax=Melia azedarach TaxID=155640 RepID=A0ACC1Y218_MELAZ|nr:hypothetical protein OWV82_012337 [Melia azedarach]
MLISTISGLVVIRPNLSPNYEFSRGIGVSPDISNATSNPITRESFPDHVIAFLSNATCIRLSSYFAAAAAGTTTNTFSCCNYSKNTAVFLFLRSCCLLVIK